MTLHSPFSISARLLPALRIAGATLSLDRGATFILDLPDGSEHTIDDFRPGAGDRSPVSWFAAILCFLGAAAESRQGRERRGEAELDEDGNEGLFPPAVVDWAAQNIDEIRCMQCELEENEGLIEGESDPDATPRNEEQAELAERLLEWHGGQSSGLYAVGSCMLAEAERGRVYRPENHHGHADGVQAYAMAIADLRLMMSGEAGCAVLADRLRALWPGCSEFRAEEETEGAT